MQAANQSTFKALGPLLLTVFLDLVGVGVVIPIAAPLLLDPKTNMLPIDYTLAHRSIILGFLLGSFALAQFFGAPILGAMADRYGRKIMLTASLVGTCIGYIIFALGIYEKSIFLCFLSRIVDGFTGGNIVIAMSSIADVTDEKNRARNFGLVGMSFGIGFVLGPYIGGKLADPSIVSWFNFATPYWFVAGLSAVNILLISLLFTETLPKATNTKISFNTGFKNIYAAFSDPSLRTIFFVVFFFAFGFNCFTQFFQVFMIEKHHYNLSDIANMFAYIGMWLAVTQGALTRPLSKKFQPHRIPAISLLCLGIAMPFLIMPDQSKYLYFILPFIAVFNGLSTPNITALVSLKAGPEKQGSIMGINQSMQSLAMAIPPIMAGFITSININLPIITASCCIIISWLIFVIFFKKPQN